MEYTQVESIFEHGLFRYHYAKAESGNITYTVVVEELCEDEDKKQFIARLDTRSKILSVISNFEDEQDSWLSQNFNYDYLRGLEVDAVEYLTFHDKDDLPMSEQYGQCVFHSDVDELVDGNLLMVV